MLAKAAALAEAARLTDLFQAAGAMMVEADILQPASTLLDLYGEDIRARAYVTHDPIRGELMLRPDFTVPVVEMHMAHGADPARYAYAGEVFRQQEQDEDRASEYLQVGYEVFDRENPASADAEVFALFSKALDGLGLRAATGDIGILTAAVRGLKTSDARKAALLRHLWRPKRFRFLLDRYSGRAEMPLSRQVLLAEAEPLRMAVPMIGLRSLEEIGARISNLHRDAREAPISEGEVELLGEILKLQAKSPLALKRLRDIATEMPAIVPAVQGLQARLAALSDRGVDVDALDFEASYGRTAMEYYDGFVFGLYAEGQDMPAVASGGRYDALTRVLGQGRSIPAVGGVIRPDLVLRLREGTT